MPTATEKKEYPVNNDRSSSYDLAAQRAIIDKSPVIRDILDNIPTVAAILNSSWQIVLANKALCDFSLRDETSTVGLRIGDLLECAVSSHGCDGCGTDYSCNYCGLISALQDNDKTDDADGHTFMLRSTDNSEYYFKVTVATISIATQQYILLTLR